MSEPDPIVQPMLQVSCPTCQKKAELADISEWPRFPFCSPRCKLIDLGRWLGEDYRLPESDESDPSTSEEPAS